jgi:hypothetical protein
VNQSHFCPAPVVLRILFLFFALLLPFATPLSP